MSHFKILILGGGSGGISIASRLTRRFFGEIAILEPSRDHYYQPLWTLVGAGVVAKEKTRRSQRDLIPKGVKWIEDSVARVQAELNRVVTAQGLELTYDYLVVATGLRVDFTKIQGLEGNWKNGVGSIYSFDGAEAFSKILNDFRGGHALFTMPPIPIKCAGAPQKIMYLADEIFRRNGVRDRCQITFASAGKSIFGVPVFAEALNRVVERKNIQTLYSHRLVAVNAELKEATFVTEHGERTIKFDLIHIVPPMSAHSYVLDSGLSHESGPQQGWLAVDLKSLQHQKYPNIFGIGDVTGVPNSKTGAAIRKQAPVVVANLLYIMSGRKPTREYDGYSSCPLVTGFGKVILAEFGYEGKLLPSFPLDPTKERWSMWILKRYLLPPFYWICLLKGRA